MNKNNILAQATLNLDVFLKSLFTNIMDLNNGNTMDLKT